MEFEAERNEKQERLKPRLIGCVWFKNTDNDHDKGLYTLFLVSKTPDFYS